MCLIYPWNLPTVLYIQEEGQHIRSLVLLILSVIHVESSNSSTHDEGWPLCYLNNLRQWLPFKYSFNASLPLLIWKLRPRYVHEHRLSSDSQEREWMLSLEMYTRWVEEGKTSMFLAVSTTVELTSAVRMLLDCLKMRVTYGQFADWNCWMSPALSAFGTLQAVHSSTTRS